MNAVLLTNWARCSFSKNGDFSLVMCLEPTPSYSHTETNTLRLSQTVILSQMTVGFHGKRPSVLMSEPARQQEYRRRFRYKWSRKGVEGRDE
jgi:hypothetical protein